MIRINLLATERAAAKPAAAPGALQLYLMLGLALGAGLVVAGLGYLAKESAIAELQSQIAQKEQEKKDLEAIQIQVTELQRKEDVIKKQVGIIQELQRQRDSAMEMMTVVSASLPDFVWLTDMSQTGNRVNFKGQSSTLTSIADFISNLQGAGEHCGKPDPAQRSGCYFGEVNLVNSQQAQTVINFDLAATFQVPQAPAPPAPAGQKPAAPAAAKS